MDWRLLRNMLDNIFSGIYVLDRDGNADGGTLFLDEINSMPVALQSKILRVLENRRCKRIGSVKEKYIDFRLLAATNQDLEQCVKDGNFRQNLRICVAWKNGISFATILSKK